MTPEQAAAILAWVYEAFRADVESSDPDDRQNAERSAAVEALMRSGRFHLLARPSVEVGLVTDAGSKAYAVEYAAAPANHGGGAVDRETHARCWCAFIVAVVAKADELAAKKVA